MSNSSLVSYTRISPNRSSPRNHSIDTISIHVVVGQLSAEGICSCFTNPSVQASCNYGIGTDGRIALCVEEKDRSWCTSSASNDNRAITIECASDTTHPYAINSRVYASLINLLVDICKRNGIPSLKWKGDRNLIGQPDKQNMTVHRWFANKACPGDYVYNRLGQIASDVNKKLGSSKPEKPSNPSKPSKPSKPEKPSKYPKTPFPARVISDNLSYRSKPSKKGTALGLTGKGTFTIVEEKNGWGKLKSGAGWIYLGDETKCTVDGVTANDSKWFSVEVNIDDLHIRSEPTSSSQSNGYTGKGTFTIVEEKNGWGKLKSGAGWISLKYATRK